MSTAPHYTRSPVPLTLASPPLGERIEVWGLVVVLALGVLLAPLSADAQQAAKTKRIGVLTSTHFGFVMMEAPSDPLPWLAESGYVHGRDLVYEMRSAGGKDDQLPSLAAELVGLGVEVIVARGTPAIRAAKEASRTIPIVMIAGVDPVKAGLVSSLARPGGNVTGVTTLTAELNRKRLQLLTEAVPRLKRVAVLWNPGDSEKADEWEALRAAARLLGVGLHSLEVRSARDFGAAFRVATRERVGAVLVLADRLTVSHTDAIVDLAGRSRLPAIYPIAWLRDVDSAGLMSYAPSRLDVSRRAAALVGKILKGAKPADLPVEEPTEFQLVVNLKAARAIGLKLPPSLLLRANKVIE